METVPATVVKVMTATEWVLIIGAIATNVIAIIGAIAAAIAMVRAGKIHTLVNSALDAEKLKVTMRDAVILAKTMELETAERTRLALAATPMMSVPVTVETTPPSVIITPGDNR